MTPEYRQHVAGMQARWFYRYSVKQLMRGLSNVGNLQDRAEQLPDGMQDAEPATTAEIIQLFPKKG